MFKVDWMAEACWRKIGIGEVKTGKRWLVLTCRKECRTCSWTRGPASVCRCWRPPSCWWRCCREAPPSLRPAPSPCPRTLEQRGTREIICWLNHYWILWESNFSISDILITKMRISNFDEDELIWWGHFFWLIIFVSMFQVSRITRQVNTKYPY